MPEYMIAFNDEWTPVMSMDTLAERGRRGRAVCAEMEAAGVFVFSHGGLDASTAIASVVPDGEEPVFTDGPFVEAKEHFGGLAIIEAPDDETARYWAGRIAVAVGWPQELHRFPDRKRLPKAAKFNRE
jgi:hypothetical protein